VRFIKPARVDPACRVSTSDDDRRLFLTTFTNRRGLPFSPSRSSPRSADHFLGDRGKTACLRGPTVLAS